MFTLVLRSSNLNERFAGVVDFSHEVAHFVDAPLPDGDGLRGAEVLTAGRLADGGPRRLSLLGDHIVDAALATIVTLIEGWFKETFVSLLSI